MQKGEPIPESGDLQVPEPPPLEIKEPAKVEPEKPAVMETEESWATEIRRTRHIGDFSRWKDHDVYQEALERLLRDLKVE